MRVAMAGLVVAAMAGPALAQGTISGRVRLDRVPPPLPASKIAKDATVCGKEAASDVLKVSGDRGLAQVVVAVRGVKPGTPPPPVPNAAVDQVGCRYTPHVQAVTVGTKLSVLNNDAVFHNVHANLQMGTSQVTVFNVAMPFKGQKLPQVLKRPGIVKLRCDAGHTWMSAWIHVFDHPHYAVTDGEGRFTIKDVPAGKHHLELWHEPLGEKQPPLGKTVAIEVADGKTATVDVELTP